MSSVAIIGASAKPERPSHEAVVRYVARGWTVWPVHPSGEAVAGVPCFRRLADLPGRPDIVCLYVNPTAGAAMMGEIAAVAPTLVWLNPGADGEPVVSAARAAGLPVIEACTLVVLGHSDPLAAARRAGVIA